MLVYNSTDCLKNYLFSFRSKVITKLDILCFSFSINSLARNSCLFNNRVDNFVFINFIYACITILLVIIFIAKLPFAYVYILCRCFAYYYFLLPSVYVLPHNLCDAELICFNQLIYYINLLIYTVCLKT